MKSGAKQILGRTIRAVYIKHRTTSKSYAEAQLFWPSQTARGTSSTLTIQAAFTTQAALRCLGRLSQLTT